MNCISLAYRRTLFNPITWPLGINKSSSHSIPMALFIPFDTIPPFPFSLHPSTDYNRRCPLSSYTSCSSSIQFLLCLSLLPLASFKLSSEIRFSSILRRSSDHKTGCSTIKPAPPPSLILVHLLHFNAHFGHLSILIHFRFLGFINLIKNIFIFN